jgi:hypothetical protein
MASSGTALELNFVLSIRQRRFAGIMPPNRYATGIYKSVLVSRLRRYSVAVFRPDSEHSPLRKPVSAKGKKPKLHVSAGIPPSDPPQQIS